ncbi:MAG: DNA polymerase, partial [Nitrososphaera sp.]|uniref:DNA polymerase n=1 Tax=Nitrososphaera sp. TaxID=1971748 RepID=UPI003D6FA91E
MTKRLSEKWINLYHDFAGFYVARWYSAGYLAEKFLINNGIAFPSFDSIPYPVQELAWRSYVGGRIEVLRRGFIGHANQYDINSAYPHKIANLPDLTDGRWIQAKAIHPDARIGFFEIVANIPDTKRVAPFPFHVPGSVLFPTGRFKTYVTIDELRVCENEDYYRILRSWQYIPNTDRKPYKGFIESLYDKRLALKQAGNPLQLPIKVVMNSIYGKTGQKVNRVIGNLFNPVIFANITGSTRAQMYRFVVDNGLEGDVVAFATDAICTARDLDIKSSRLGDFSFDKSGDDVYYLQNGIYRFNEKWKLRGIGSIGGKTVEHIDNIEKDGRLYLVLTPTRSASLRECIIQGRIQDIGKIKPVRRLVNLNADRKRLWLGTL